MARTVSSTPLPALPDLPAVPRERHDGLTLDRQRRFLEALAATGSVTDAAQASGLSRQALYRHRNRQGGEAFRAAWDRAQDCATGLLGDVAIERALHGVEEPVFWKGEQVGTRRRFNDKLLMFLLRGRAPFDFAPLPDLRGFAGGEARPLPGLDTMIERIEAQGPAPSAGPPGITRF